MERNYWEENGHVKYDNYNSNDDGFGRGCAAEQLNFAAAPSEDEGEYPAGGYLKKGKVSRQDPMSHRIIEKRRRDRMNNCLADLSRLIPPEYLKKGRGRVEKTEIIEMAIKHLKFLQERANGLYHGTNRPDNAAESQVGQFRAGYQEAVADAVRYLTEVHGFGPADGLCVQLAAHLRRHCDQVTKGDVLPRKPHSQGGSSSETTSSSGSSHGYVMKPGVITSAPPPAATSYSSEQYEPEQSADQHYPMECDRVTLSQLPTPVDGDISPDEPLPLDGRRKREPTLRAVRKPDHHDDYLHSYKFKNSIERRFSRSQDSEQAAAEMEGLERKMSYHKIEYPAIAADMLVRTAHNKVYSHKRRRAQAKPAPSTSTSNSGSTEEARDTSPQDTSSESPHQHHYEKPPLAQYVPVFALNALGKYYVPLSVEHACLAKHLGAHDVLDARAGHLPAPLHPVTIHVNFQPCLSYHVKREPSDREWRAP